MSVVWYRSNHWSLTLSAKGEMRKEDYMKLSLYGFLFSCDVNNRTEFFNFSFSSRSKDLHQRIHLHLNLWIVQAAGGWKKKWMTWWRPKHVSLSVSTWSLCLTFNFHLFAFQHCEFLSVFWVLLSPSISKAFLFILAAQQDSWYPLGPTDLRELESQAVRNKKAESGGMNSFIPLDTGYG